MPDDPERVAEDEPPPARLTPQEQAVYEEVRRAQTAIDAALAALGSARDARARTLLRTVKEQADGLRHMLEWQARHRDGPAAPSPASPDAAERGDDD